MGWAWSCFFEYLLLEAKLLEGFGLRMTYGLYTVIVLVLGMIVTTKLDSLTQWLDAPQGIEMFLTMMLHAFGLMAGWAFKEELKLLLPYDDEWEMKYAQAVTYTLLSAILFHFLDQNVISHHNVENVPKANIEAKLDPQDEDVPQVED